MPTHQSHTLHRCEDQECMVCNGGLALCTVCGGGEASLPTHCPGRKMTARESDEVQAGQLDFKNGQWSSD